MIKYLTVETDSGTLQTLYPRIGYWYTYCCSEDMEQIKDQETIDTILAEFEEGEHPLANIVETYEEGIERWTP